MSDVPARDVGTTDPSRQLAESCELAGAAPERALTPAAKRALAEAAERRAAVDRRAAAIAANPERNGRGGLEPVRYDDWEIAGKAVDF